MPALFDLSYILIFPALILSFWAQYRVKSTFQYYSRQNIRSGKTAAQIAQEILHSYGIGYVKIAKTPGSLTDHYDPRDKTLRLSESVYDSSSVSAVGVAAHEAGHAVQHAKGYIPLIFRNTIVPGINISSWAAIPLFLIGLVLRSKILITIGIFFYAGVVIFHFFTLPVEFDASRRALAILKKNYFSEQEYSGAKKVLQAAALTYIASALMAVLELVRLIFLSRNTGDHK
ncbi:MAG TPA: zinc metallopeptidase [Spirochaetia bacterium]|nr:MAG: hypothetical protein A2Y41_03780 [Spirochaetes bacterium GWB1_36_13]HCL55924.1 zinc metallopeptidase [Spirochaetia bacterium]